MRAGGEPDAVVALRLVLGNAEAVWMSVTTDRQGYGTGGRGTIDVCTQREVNRAGGGAEFIAWVVTRSQKRNGGKARQACDQVANGGGHVRL